MASANNAYLNNIEQWVSAIPNFSSEYAQAWGANTLIGRPKAYPAYGDQTGTWAPLNYNAVDWVELQFEEEIFIEEIHIYETYHAGCVTSIAAKSPGGEWLELYTSAPQDITESRIFKPDIQRTTFASNKMKITVDSRPCNDWVEIDAVMIKGRKFLTDPPPPLETLAEDLSELVNQDLFSDVEFLVEGQVFKGHKGIFATRSSCFRKLLSDKNNRIKVPNISCEAFENMLHYIYTNSVKKGISATAICELARVADKFALKGLENLCTTQMCLNLDSSNVVPIYTEATQKKPVLSDVKNACLDYIGRNMNKVSSTEEFSKLPKEQMLEIIQQATAQMSVK